MHTTIRRQDRAIDEAETIAILQNSEFGVLSMCTEQNEAYGIPLNYVYFSGALYFHCAPEGAKLNHLRNNAKASFCVVGRTLILPSKFGTCYESAIAVGSISVAEGDEKQQALLQFIDKYSGDFKEEGKEYIAKLFDRVRVLKLTIQSLSGKARKQ